MMDDYEGSTGDNEDLSQDLTEGYQTLDMSSSDLPPEDVSDLMDEYGNFIDLRETTGDYTGQNATGSVGMRQEEELSREIASVKSLDVTGNNPLVGAMTSEDIHLGRISHFKIDEQKATLDKLQRTTFANDDQLSKHLDTLSEFQTAISGNSETVWDTETNNYVVRESKGNLESFTKKLHSSIRPEHLPSEVKSIDPKYYVPNSIEIEENYDGSFRLKRSEGLLAEAAPELNNITGKVTRNYSRQANRKAAQFMTGAERYNVRGVGDYMPLNESEFMESSNANMQKAMQIAKKLSPRYLPEGLTKIDGQYSASALKLHTSEELDHTRNIRLHQIHNSLVQYALDGNGKVPFPEQLKNPDGTMIRGLKKTRNATRDIINGKRTAAATGGSPYGTVLEYDKYATEQGWLNKDGIVEEHSKSYWANRPNLANTLFDDLMPFDDDTDSAKELRKLAADEFGDMISEGSGIVKAQMNTNADDAYGNSKRSGGFYSPYGEQSDAQYIRDELARQGIEGGFGNEATTDNLDGMHLSGEKPVDGSVSSSAVVSGNLIYPTATIKESFKTSSSVPSVDSEGRVYYPTIDDERDKIVQVMGPPKLATTTQGILREDLLIGDMLRTAGSEKGGMYGERDLDDMSIGVEKGLEEIERNNLLSKMPHLGLDFEGIPQRSVAWYAARNKLNVTASEIVGSASNFATEGALTSTINKKKKEAENRKKAHQLGVAIPSGFKGNYSTGQGQKTEDTSIRRFLEKNPNYNFKEVGLIQNPKFPGLGASPDGRLYNDDGELESLLEIKYLKDISEKGTAKYDAQAQFQMMIEEVDKTELFAVDSLTMRTSQRTIHADKGMQKRIRQRINAAIVNSGGNLSDLSEEEVEQLFNEENESSSQKESFDGDVKAEEEMTTFGDDSSTPSSSVGSSNISAETPSINLAEEKKDFVGPHRKEGKKEAVAEAAKVAEQKKAERNADKEAAKADKEAAKADKEAAKAARERAKADREASKATRNFSKAVRESLDKLSKGAINTNESSMDFVRLGDETGLSGGKAKNLVESLEEMGMSDTGAFSTVTKVGNIRTTLMNSQLFANEYGKQVTAYSASRTVDGRSFNEAYGNFLSPDKLRGLATEGTDALLAEYANMAEQMSPADRTTFQAALGINFNGVDFSIDRDLRNERFLNEDGANSFREAEATIENIKDTVTQGLVNFTGSAGGVAAGLGALGLGGAFGLSKLMAAKKVRDAVTSTQKPSAVKGGKTSLTKSERSTMNLAKNAGKLTAGGFASDAIGSTARGMFGIEDDGGVADSLMDIAEFTMAGAGFGIKGAAVGAVAGVGNELLEMAGFNFEDIVPSKGIADKPVMSRGNDINNVNDIDVNVVVNKDGVETNVRSNGEDYTDYEAGT